MTNIGGPAVEAATTTSTNSPIASQIDPLQISLKPLTNNVLSSGKQELFSTSSPLTSIASDIEYLDSEEQDEQREENDDEGNELEDTPQNRKRKAFTLSNLSIGTEQLRYQFLESKKHASIQSRTSSLAGDDMSKHNRGRGRNRGCTMGKRTKRVRKSVGISGTYTIDSDLYLDPDEIMQQKKTLERQEGDAAARASRLPPHELSAEELQVFRGAFRGRQHVTYLEIRNRILALWLRNPTRFLSLEQATSVVHRGKFVRLAQAAYEFLARHSYINFGYISRPFPERPSSSMRKVIVVGAGIAGIACARQLYILLNQFYPAEKEVPQVILLEARGRLGGRIFTYPLQQEIPAQFRDKIKAEWLPERPYGIDLGAQVITGLEGGNPMHVIIQRQLAIPLHFLLTECKLYDGTGNAVDSKIDRQCEEMFNNILDRACGLKQVENGGLTEELLEFCRKRGDPIINEKGGEKESCIPTLGTTMDYFLELHPQFKTLTPTELSIVHWHYANLEFANATSLSKLSLHHWDQDDGYEFMGEHSMVQGGYGRIPHALALGPEPIDIRLRTPVNLIEYTMEAEDSGVCIHCKDGVTLDADACVVTIPLGVLKAGGVQFDPKLPTWKQEAIERLGFGLLNKVILLFPYAFWDESLDMFGYTGEGPQEISYDPKFFVASRGKFYMFWNCMKVIGLPVLIALLAGESAYICENASDEDLVAEAVQILQRIHQRGIPYPLESVVSRWSLDEFARGSYSNIGPMGQGEDYDLMAKPIGNVFFAGEATCRNYPATVHGAYISGCRAASQVLDSLVGKLHYTNEELFPSAEDMSDENDYKIIRKKKLYPKKNHWPRSVRNEMELPEERESSISTSSFATARSSPFESDGSQEQMDRNPKTYHATQRATNVYR
ncbi:uncharacterized protein VTP21DRAFT_7215 [Calcarisporiella thermophila]|uniref:uncharacterized protein n=1 Tax=Calcarisporiella thermophila TaxID=911321 RepID=UPI003742F11C